MPKDNQNSAKSNRGPDPDQLSSGGQKSLPNDDKRVEPDLTGTTINGTYEIIAVLGEESLSTVYKARRLVSNEMVALKLMHPHLCSVDAAFNRFEHEIEVCERFDHPNLVAVLDSRLDEDQQPYLVVELLEGSWSLADVLKAEKQIDLSRCLHIFIQVCSALAYAHQQGTFHHDLKPKNILLVRHNADPDFVKLVGFGTNAFAAEEGVQDTNVKIGELYSSSLYMSPELCLDSQGDGRSDIYSIGCLIYRSLMGRPPFEGGDLAETRHKQIHDEPSPLRAIDPDARLVKRLSQTIQKCMEKSASKRFATMLELQQNLEQVQKLDTSKVRTRKENVRDFDTDTKIAKSRSLSRIFALIIASLIILVSGASLWYGAQLLDTRSDPTESERHLKLRFSFEMPDDLEKLKKLDKSAAGNTDQNNEKPVGLREFYDQLQVGDRYLRVGRFSDALKHYQIAAKTIGTGLLDKDGFNEADLERGEALCYLGLDKPKLADNHSLKAMDYLCKESIEKGQIYLSVIGILMDSARLTVREQANWLVERFEWAYGHTYSPSEKHEPSDLRPTYPYQMGVALKQAGDCAIYIHQEPLGISFYKRALSEWRRYAQGSPDRNLKFNEAVLLNDLGLLALTSEQYQVANENFKEAGELIESNASAAQALAIVLFNRADALKAQQKWLEAMTCRSKAQQIWRDIANHKQQGLVSQTEN